MAAADAVRAAVVCLGPVRDAARIEHSKAFAIDVMAAPVCAPRRNLVTNPAH